MGALRTGHRTTTWRLSCPDKGCAFAWGNDNRRGPVPAAGVLGDKSYVPNSRGKCQVRSRHVRARQVRELRGRGANRSPLAAMGKFNDAGQNGLTVYKMRVRRVVVQLFARLALQLPASNLSQNSQMRGMRRGGA